MKEEKVLTREEVKQEMLEYIEHKYDEEFEVYGMDYKSWGNGGIETMLAYPKGGNSNYYFNVRRYGENDIRDDYVLFTMGEIYEKKATEIVKAYFPEAVVRVGISSSQIPDSFRPSMNFNEFKKFADKKVTLTCNIYMIAEEQKEIDSKKVELFETDMKKLSAIANIHFEGYSYSDYQTYILNDPYSSRENNTAYSNTGLRIRKKLSWGQVDFDYKYEEE